MVKRRLFLKKAGLAGMASLAYGISPAISGGGRKKKIITVKGAVSPSRIGFTLTHEHVLVDFIGADAYNPARWSDEEVIRVVTPYLQEIRERGCDTLVECTPEFIGRDPGLLRQLSEKTDIHILTNTGYYGASINKYLPAFIYSESSGQLADRWIKEFNEGIGETGIRPGFMKIGVAPGPLSLLHRKLVTAAAITHKQTGMPIASHTGPAVPAFEQINLLSSMDISPEMFIWVHAQNEASDKKRLEAATMGAWVSLDGVNEDTIDQYVQWLLLFRKEGLLNRVLVSHDAGWYSPGEANGGSFRAYTVIFDQLIPALENNGFTPDDIKTIFVKNAARAFSIRFA